MERTEKIIMLRNEVEARLISEILNDKGIPHIIRSYHDSAYDGIFQTQSGWGHLEALPVWREIIIGIYNEMSAGSYDMPE